MIVHPMSKERPMKRIYCSVVVLCLLAICPAVVWSQSGLEDDEPYGENTIGVQTIGGNHYVWTPRGLYEGEEDPVTHVPSWIKVFPPKNLVAAINDDIAGGILKNGYVYILMKSGAITRTPKGSPERPILMGSVHRANPSEDFEKITGDALYILSNFQFLVSRDTAITWIPDTAGFGGVMPSSFAIDSLQYVYVTRPTGIYRQHTDSMTWNKLTSFTGSTPKTIFADRGHRILVSSYDGNMYLSTDRGSTWSIDTVGLNKQLPLSFGDDVFRNLYVITGSFLKPTKLFRSLGGNQPWTRIDQPITNLIPDIANYDGLANPAFHSIAGDSLLFLGTAFGVFFSTDQGTTWKEANTGIHANLVYGYAKTKSGRSLMSTNLGVFSRNVGGADWIKSFPAQGYNTGKGFTTDASGNVYTLGPRLNTTSSSNPLTPFKSTDGGLTWNTDTAGFSVVGSGTVNQYFVDEAGTQYLASSDAQGKLFTKKAGQSWTVDSIGYSRGTTARYVTMFGSDHKGTVYVGTLDLLLNTGLLLSRPLSGGVWNPDTSGLGTDQVYTFTNDKSGNFFAGSINHGLVKKIASDWFKVPMPATFSNGIPFDLSVDSSNALFAAFSVASGFSYNWNGVYFTTDGGTNWTYAGLNQVSIQQLISYGDTTYAVTYANGVYKLTRTAAAGVSMQVSIPGQFQLYQNFPNPFNPTTTIEFTLPEDGKVSLKIYDLLGREMATLVNGPMKGGVLHQVTFDAAKLASGIYFSKLVFKDEQQIKKLILMK